jgi:hypothetical protein
MKRGTKLPLLLLLLLLVFLSGTGYYMLQTPQHPTKPQGITIDSILASEQSLRLAVPSPENSGFLSTMAFMPNPAAKLGD